MRIAAVAALRVAFAALAALGTVIGGLALAPGCALRDPPDPALHAVDIRSVRVDPATESPVVLLVERSGLRRELPIWVGLPQAESIALGLEDVALPRPNTHDLLMRLVEGMGGSVRRVVVTDLRDNVYYAVIELEADGRVISIDARPSDALALAVRGKVEIFATDTVLRSNIPADEETRPLDVQWRAPDARALRDFEVTEETESLPAI